MALEGRSKGKVSQVHYRANELTSRFTNAQNDSLEVIVRVSDRDVALAYRLSSLKKKRVVIRSEATGFKLPQSATAFVTPQVRWGGGFAASKPSYEEPYFLDLPVARCCSNNPGNCTSIAHPVFCL